MGNRKVFDFLTGILRIWSSGSRAKPKVEFIPPNQRSDFEGGYGGGETTGATKSMGGGRGGQKRGRTQRRHFRQSRENVWKYGNKKTRAEEELAATDSSARVDRNPSWEPFATQNAGFEEYYKEQGIVPKEEWEEFNSLLRKPLPAAFRINARRAESTKLRKNQTLERFHEFLKQENEVGTITRQEAVSMVPPLFLDVCPDHYILDMCAAPGSKTFQLLEIIHQSVKPGLLPNGLVIANDVDVQRCNLLIHQTKRMCSANLIVTNHEAQYFPSCLSVMDSPREARGELKKEILQFDRVLCDVPCSGDGTLRKAPDIWRKWNAGMGNGLHRLQVEIAMRGVSLLKLGGRMVYSTCSLNPVENEAVVSEILKRSKGSVELLDVSSELPELVRRPGLMSWKVRDKGVWLAAYEDVPMSRKGVIFPSMFPCDLSCKENDSQFDNLEDTSGFESSRDEEHYSFNPKKHPVDVEGSEKEDGCRDEKGDFNETKAKISSFPLERCMRILPHDQNSGAFFIAVLQKVSSGVDDSTKGILSGNRNYKGSMSSNEGDKQMVRPSMDVSQDGSIAADETGCKLEDEMTTKVGIEKTNETLQNKEKWRGIDPVVLFRDESMIENIRSFYGISDSFPMDGHLVSRSSDANHVKRIYYISKSVHDVLQLNFKVGQKLRIASLGLKVFERQTSKDVSATCPFRLSSEGLSLLLPYISKQILCATLVDFRHLLQYRTIKFPDFVDGDFRDKASALMSGCCIIALQEGHQIPVDSSAIAIVCWKGKTNLSIMVSQLDAQELLDRLEVRFGKQKGSSESSMGAEQEAVCEEDIGEEF
ncbi:hypothetical protein HPP92_013110 [Vanilla planifolia]|uniref:SAM-dependent MTase RsmB/NOP-type domain-containing protein n=1 Tax=Vanilla planifolia TaxID=51239 RepID=A0A835QPD8_VANPL|nr:hypothetical protein HPP92_013110 [Vanilla planifolia]